MEALPPTRKAEFRRAWRTVLCAAFGSGLGVSGLLTYNSGLFVKGLEAQIGLTRSTFGLVFFLSTVAMAVALPIVGRRIDREGSRRSAMAGAATLSLGFAALGLLTASVATYAALMVLIGLLATGSSPVSYTRAVSRQFSAGRGLALGLTQMGIGMAGALVPPVVSMVILSSGWRAGFMLLAALALAGLIPAFLTDRGSSAWPLVPSDPVAFARVVRSGLFWRQLAAFAVMAIGFAGFLPHFVPLLMDAGVPARTAAFYAAMIGVSVIISRVIIGALADIIHAPFLAAIVCALSAGGCLSLAWGGTKMALIAAIAFGAAMGAEADLVGYMTARHFGITVYGRAYAWQYAAFMLAAGASPAWIGLVRDRTGNYDMAMVIAAMILVFAITLFVSLPRTRVAES